MTKTETTNEKDASKKKSTSKKTVKTAKTKIVEKDETKKETGKKAPAKKPAVKKTAVKKTPAKKTAATKKETAEVTKTEKHVTKHTELVKETAQTAPTEKPVAQQPVSSPAQKPAEQTSAEQKATAEVTVEKPIAASVQKTTAPVQKPVQQPVSAPKQVQQPTVNKPFSKPQEHPQAHHGQSTTHAQKPAPQTGNASAQRPTQQTSAAQKAAPAKDDKTIRIVGQPTVKELAEKMNFKINDFIKKLMTMGIFATINQRLEKDMIELIVEECGFKAEMVAEDLDKDTIAVIQTEDDPTSLKPRSPVITIMGHVDHGKTSLLDAIRKSNVVAGEAGAITQHIGAYRVKTPRGVLTFLDTPGHEAFTAMRARGAQATDIVVLVVSATDGIMPQTIEAMEHAKAAGAPIIVAVNKIDLPGANPDRVRQDLAARGLVPEEWQGTTIFVDISAKKNLNIDKLLEMISLQAEMMELKANPDRLGVGVILESKRDNKRGVVATVLVQKGTMKVGDPFLVGTNYGRIRALIDENSQRYQTIGPSVPAEILGINGEPPQVGDTLYIMESEKEARYAAEKRKLAQREDSQEHRKQMSLMALGKSDEEGNKVKKLSLILKADVQGSIEAIKDALLRIPSDEVEVDIILSAPGNIKESDISLAEVSNAVVIGFNVNADSNAQADAERKGIEIRKYTIIFELLEDIKAAMEGLLEPDVVETVVGTATIKKVLKLSSGIISGSLVESGTIYRNYEVRIKRNGEEVGHGKVGGLKRFKDDVKEVEKGYECGILIEGFKGVAEGDVIECFKKENVTRRIKM